MQYSKKIIILNEMTSGFSRGTARGVGNVEKTPSRIEATVNIFGLESLKSGEFIIGVGSKNLKIQKFNTGNIGRINIKFPLNYETDMDSPLYITVVFKDGDTVVPVLFGSNGNRKTMTMNMLDGFIDRSEERGIVEFMDDLHYGDSETDNGENSVRRETPGRGGQSVPYAATSYAVRAEPPAAAYAEPLSQTAPAKERKREDAPYYWEPFKRDAAAADTIRERETVSESKEDRRGAFAPAFETSAERPLDKKISRTEKGFSEKDFPNLTEKYLDNQVAAENYYPAGYGIGEAGFTIANNAEVNKIDPGKIMLKKPVLSFYQNVRSQLDELFKKYPPEDNLNRKLPGTSWVKVDYNSNGKFYIVGLIGDEPKYICYGVPATYTAEIPEELTNCQWLPLSDEKPDGEGYWVMYQSAETGETVELEIM